MHLKDYQDGSKQVCRLKQTCTPTGAARKYLTTVTDVLLMNYAVSLDEARDGTQKNTQCKLPIDILPLQQLASSPALMSCLSKQTRRWFLTAVGDTVPKKRHVNQHVMSDMMMMIAFITIKSSLVPLIEGLCAQIYFRFEISVVCSHLLLFFFCERKNMLKE